MLENISSAEEVLDFFEIWLIKQFGNNAASLENCLIHSKAELLINEDVNFWANRSMWDLYNTAKAA